MANQAVTECLSVKYMFVSSNKVFSLANCFRSLWHHIVQHLKMPLTPPNKCLTFALADDFCI